MVMHTFAEFLNMMTIEKAHLTKHRPTPAEFQPMLDDLPPDVAAHVIYVRRTSASGPTTPSRTSCTSILTWLSTSLHQFTVRCPVPPGAECITARTHTGSAARVTTSCPEPSWHSIMTKSWGQYMCDVMCNISSQSFHTVLSIENPLPNFQHMPLVKCLLGSPGWMEHMADHCMLQHNGERLFPCKQSTWLLYNVRTDAKLQCCDGSCCCTVPGMYSTNLNRAHPQLLKLLNKRLYSSPKS